MGTYAGVDYNSPYLTVNSVVSYPLPLQRERGAVGIRTQSTAVASWRATDFATYPST